MKIVLRTEPIFATSSVSWASSVTGAESTHLRSVHYD